MTKRECFSFTPVSPQRREPHHIAMAQSTGISTCNQQMSYTSLLWTPDDHHRNSSSPTTVADTSSFVQNLLQSHNQSNADSSREDQRDLNGVHSTTRPINGDKYKRNRTIFNAAQLDALAKIFRENQYPDAVLRKKIAERLEIDEERIQIWFQNRRAKTKRIQRNGHSKPATKNLQQEKVSSHSSPVSQDSSTMLTCHPQANALPTPPMAASEQLLISGRREDVDTRTMQRLDSTRYSGRDSKCQQTADQQSNICDERQISGNPPCLSNSFLSAQSQQRSCLHRSSTPGVTATSVPSKVENGYTQHYISNKGFTSRVLVSNAGRSTQGRLRPETRIMNPPPNRVCTALPEEDKNELSKALFLFGLAIGQSAGLDTSELKSPRDTAESKETANSEIVCQRAAYRNRRRHERQQYAYDSDTSSDCDEANSRKRRRRANGDQEGEGPPNRVITAVPLTDRTLPLPCLPHKKSTMFANAIEEAQDVLRSESNRVSQSSFSIDIMSSPEPRSSPMSPSSTSSSSFSDWSDIDDVSVAQPLQPNPTVTHHVTDIKSLNEKIITPLSSFGAEHSISKGAEPTNTVCNMHEQNGSHRSENRCYMASQFSPQEHLNRNQFGASADTEQYHVAHCRQNTADDYQTERHKCQRSLSQHTSHHTSPSMTSSKIPLDGAQVSLSATPELIKSSHSSVHLPLNSRSPGLVMREEFELPIYASKPSRNWLSSTCSEENRRNQVSEIMAESRRIADQMSNSPASPWSGDSGTRSPASWAPIPSPQPFMQLNFNPYEGGVAVNLAQANVTSEQQLHPCRLTTPTSSQTPPMVGFAFEEGLSSCSVKMTENSPHTVVRPIATFPSKPMSFQPSIFRPSLEINMPMEHLQAFYHKDRQFLTAGR